MSGELVRYDAMCHAIAAAYRVDEVKDIRDKAMALEMYARLAQNTEAERQACEIRLRAERRMGQLLRDMEKERGRPAKASRRATLSDLGVSRNQSSRWQKLADMPDEQFDRALSVADQHPSTSGIIASVTEPKPKQMDDRALWLWGRLGDIGDRTASGDPWPSSSSCIRSDAGGAVTAARPLRPAEGTKSASSHHGTDGVHPILGETEMNFR
jgi:hypothetical protein